MKRRDALKTMGALAGAATMGRVLPGCGGDPGDDGPVGITTVVVMMMENRTYDHLLGARAFEGLPGDGLVATMSNPDRLGNAVAVFEGGDRDELCVADPPHGRSASQAQWNGGAMDGFLRAYQDALDLDTAVDAMQYLTRRHVPVSWALADNYVACDRYFASVMGPTWPNRMYWHSGTSQGIESNDVPTSGFSWDTIYHRLIAKGVEYRYYYGDVPVIAVIRGLEGNNDRIWRMDDFFADAAAGRLPPVVYIDPSFSINDDHPPHHPMMGQQLIASVYTALASSPQWKNCLFVVTYDEHGGFYDHVAPPTTVDDFAGFEQMGMRVPTLVAGPYVKTGEAISTVYDHCSVLKHIETMFELDPLNARVTAASDLSDCLDLDRLAAGAWNAPVELPAVEVDESILTDRCRYDPELREHDVLRLADTHRHLIGALDRRRQAIDTAYLIGDYLERHNAGRIRRGR